MGLGRSQHVQRRVTHN